jgi:hypothetical protein
VFKKTSRSTQDPGEEKKCIIESHKSKEPRIEKEGRFTSAII